MDAISPLSWFVLFVKAQCVLLVPALGVLWLTRRKSGVWAPADYLVGMAVVVAIVVEFIAIADFKAHYLDYTGVTGSGMLTRKWIAEGDESTSYYLEVKFRGSADDYSVSEGFWDSQTPPVSVPVMYDPGYPSDFVAKFRIQAAWHPVIVGGLLGSAALLELAVFGWVGFRLLERIRGK